MHGKFRLMIAVVCFCLLLAATTSAGPKESLEFGFVMTGGVSGAGSRFENIRGNNSPVWIGADFNLAPAFFTGDGTGLLDADGDECFYGGIFRASMQMTEAQDGSAHAVLYFRAYSSDGNDTEIKYVLTLVDSSGWSGDFPPRDDTVMMEPTEWAMTTEGKGQLRKVSCTGSGGDEIDVVLKLSQPPA